MNEVEIRERMATIILEQTAVADAHPDYDLPADVLEQVKARDKELTDLKGQWDTLQERKGLFGSANSLRSMVNDPAGAITHPALQPQQKGQDGYGQSRHKLSAQVMDDPEWKAWLKTAGPHGQFNAKTKIQSPAINIKTLITGDSTTSAGSIVFPDIQTGIIGLGRRPLALRDVVTVAQTNSDTVEYVRVTSETNNAASVAEATATGDGSGAKPESAAAFLQVTTNVTTIAHWIPITRRALADAGQMRAYIDDFLMDGLRQELEDQMMEGTGAANSLVGISGTTGIQTTVTTGNLLTAVRRGKRLVRTVGRDIPNAFVMNPVDWEGFDLLQDNEARYFFGGPRDVQNPYMWGLPVIEVEACSTGFVYVGNFKKAVLWDREQASIQVSDSHSDFFIRNIVAILAEMRAAFAVVKPNSIVQVDLTS